jgi:H+/gluconate symporter-like permease
MQSPNLRKSVGIGLGIAMVVFILWASFEGTSVSAGTVPAQTQYTSPTNTTGLPVVDYAIIGVVIAIIVAGLLYFMLFGRKGGPAVTQEESKEGTSSSSEKTKDKSTSSSGSDS